MKAKAEVVEEGGEAKWVLETQVYALRASGMFAQRLHLERAQNLRKRRVVRRE